VLLHNKTRKAFFAAMAVYFGGKMDLTLGEIVSFHRKQSGLTRNDLADLAGVGKTAIYDIENGKETIRLSTLQKVFIALNIKMTFESPLMEALNEKSQGIDAGDGRRHTGRT
jgi:y4mF family transcriptional regulator